MIAPHPSVSPTASAAVPVPVPVMGPLPARGGAHLVGIGGTGMSGLAELLAGRGFSVTGCDRVASSRTARLALRGIDVRVGSGLAEAAEGLPQATTFVVTTAAAPETHPQLVEARRRGLPVLKYAECVGALMAGRVGIAVAGCHGKTTTTSLVAVALHHAGLDPSVVVGGEVRDLGGSARAGAGPHFVVEACEYDRSFLRLAPTHALVTNVDADHLDYYRDLEEIREAFRAFARRLPANGRLVVHEAHAAVFRGDPALQAKLVTYGPSPTADWRCLDARHDPASDRLTCRVAREGREVAALSLALSGQHNAENATGALAVLGEAGVPADAAAAGLASFSGVGRRMETVACQGGVLVLDDYGHHPAEIDASVAGLRARFPGRRLRLVFQPHQASRTRHLLHEFAAALARADDVWLAPIFTARDAEEDRRAVSSADLAARVVALGGRATAYDGFEPIVRDLAADARPGDVIVTMGAGDVDEVARGLARRLP